MTGQACMTRGLMAHQVDDSGDLILHDPETGEMVVLNAVGAAAYELLDGQRTSHAIATELAEVFTDVPFARIESDVEGFIDDLLQRRLIVLATP